MKNFKDKKTLQIVLLVVITVVTLGISYAAITGRNLAILWSNYKYIIHII